MGKWEINEWVNELTCTECNSDDVQYGNSGLLAVQIGTVVLVRVSVSVWNWQYGNSGLVAVQIGTAVLVKVSVSVWIW
jgi:hypothetical protein